MDTPVILSAVRTPVGKFQGGLAGFSAVELGAKAVAEAIRRAGLDGKQVDEAILGNVVQAGLGQNPARQAALKGGCDPRVAALTINKVCGSGLKAVALAAQAVQLGESEMVVAGGMESMSNCPYLLPQARTGYRLGDGKLVDSMIHDGLWDKYEDFHMGMTGELVAEKYKITREEQDRFSFESHQKAVKARKSCFFEAQILPIEVPQKKGEPLVIRYDESPREDTSIEVLAKLKARVQERRHRHRWQRPWHQRWRRRPDRHQRAPRAIPQQKTHGSHRRSSHQRRRTEMGDDGPGGRCRKTPRQNRLGPR